ncbi:MAG: DUF4383 domain-containing protein [Gaiellaceae bacterium]
MRDRTPVQSIASVVGSVFLLVGVLGFIPGITTHYGDLSFAGHGSGAKLIGVFQVSILHNIVHVLFGVVGIVLAKTADGARSFLVGGGVVYLALWLLGIVGAGDWIPVNTADNWLHLVLGLGMVALGVVTMRRPARTAAA